MKLPLGELLSRRAAVTAALTAAAISFTDPRPTAAELAFTTAGPEGFQFADAKLGTGSAFQKGQRVAIDYVMSTTGARYGSKIDSTQDRQAPYAWTLGDGSTIAGLELAILGGDGVPPMLPGGVRRVIIPSNPKSNLAYSDLAIPNKNSLQFEVCVGKGPIPPNEPQKGGDMGAGEFQRFKNIVRSKARCQHSR
jgi:FKBP-type peptidyl-prolyl cis-trans isomerase